MQRESEILKSILVVSEGQNMETDCKMLYYR